MTVDLYKNQEHVYTIIFLFYVNLIHLKEMNWMSGNKKQDLETDLKIYSAPLVRFYGNLQF